MSAVPSGHGASLERRFAANEEPCLLTVGVVGEYGLDRVVTDREIAEWHEVAASQNFSLVARLNGSVLELYSTQQDSDAVFALPMKAIAQWSRQHPELRQLDIAFKRSDDAAMHLLTSVAGIGSARMARTTLEQLERIVAGTNGTGGSSDTIASLFRAALEVHRRVASEDLDGDPEPSDVLADLAEMSASRIVEEELLVWKAHRAEACRRKFCRRALVPALRRAG